MLTQTKHGENKAIKPVASNGSFFDRGISAPFFQAKLTVNQPGDEHEQEADALADQVIRMKTGDSPIVQRMPLTPVSGLQRACADCEKKKEEEGVMRKETGGSDASGKAAPSIVSDVLSTGGGQPMDGGTRQFMESRFGQDFSQVRIHTDSRAAESASAIQARAYTSGRNVVFGAGEYQLGSESGQRLLAHELVHVGQQGGGSYERPQVQRSWLGGLLGGLGGAAVGAGIGSIFGPLGMLAGGLIGGAIGGIAGAFTRNHSTSGSRRTIWINVGFDSSAMADVTTMRKLRASIAAAKTAMRNCCDDHSNGCNVNIKTQYDWERHNKPAPSDGDYDSDDAKDNNLRTKNLSKIKGPSGAIKVLVTESTLSQTWEGERIFPRANTDTDGVLWNPDLAADDTIAHESGHVAGYSGDAEGDAHSADPDNLMSSGAIRNEAARPDANWCQQLVPFAR